MKVPNGPTGPYRLLVRALTAGVLVSASACSLHGIKRQADAPSVIPPASSTAPSFTAAQASAALITQGELGGRWSATQGGATWRDGLLKGRTDAPDCQRLLDGLYAEDLLGEPKGPRAVVGLDAIDNAAQLRYQVAAYAAPSEVDAKLAWLRTLPAKCAQFTSTDVRGGRLNVTVVPAVLPGVGDAREGLRLTMSGQPSVDSRDTSGGGSVLTLDFAAVRVGDRAVSLTNGGLGGAAQDSTQQAVQLGTQRLQNVLAGRPPTTAPTGIPTDTPVQTPTDTPVQTPADPPTYRPAQPPADPPTYRPARPRTDPPTYRPAKPPTDPPTYTPAQTPTDTPAETLTDSTDRTDTAGLTDTADTAQEG
ncbi:hypothetical protein [Streptomyces sp. NBC_01483]|uniref:hypothetical protein n=1 Tax=Streptomyces sp. NBC_01483 TaxID=2903883 RepID=UPI002E36A82E|nr:hypothetical protein [Streptomyces sp. NBC_01483]